MRRMRRSRAPAPVASRARERPCSWRSPCSKAEATEADRQSASATQRAGVLDVDVELTDLRREVQPSGDLILAYSAGEARGHRDRIARLDREEVVIGATPLAGMVCCSSIRPVTARDPPTDSCQSMPESGTPKLLGFITSSRSSPVTPL